jgi:hypothetical protein
MLVISRQGSRSTPKPDDGLQTRIAPTGSVLFRAAMSNEAAFS